MSRYTKYTHEFRVNAVNRANETSVADAAKELGMKPRTLYKWVDLVRNGQPLWDPSKTNPKIHHTPEFKAYAVQYALDVGSVAHVSRVLNLSPDTLRGGIKAGESTHTPSNADTCSVKNELQQIINRLQHLLEAFTHD
ncbi:Transposase and inactivated derivatives [Pasteurella testudinis DSM 23072]|uniref:Transposase and inactivated derivatives n=1 Tax=Pasteurella testudinis DSM 23072 TaxID=1122938 RepID=A0A1W1UJZ8_9PAST|nr:transposase [Pasteurella testudinis]SMB81438.1 Transposase and inactivated derivatives [Pasteurella testudinis DSM 23072]SUB51410.1 Transposase [Pasteurella testudinis]